MSKLRQERIDRYSKPGDWVSGIADPAAKNLPGWQQRASDLSLHPKPQPNRKLPSPPPAIESDGVGKWR
jgi:hypothetical protein